MLEKVGHTVPLDLRRTGEDAGQLGTIQLTTRRIPDPATPPRCATNAKGPGASLHQGPSLSHAAPTKRGLHALPKRNSGRNEDWIPLDLAHGACRDRGVLVHGGVCRYDGDRGDFILIAPPLIAGKGSFEAIAEAIPAAI